MSYPPPSMVLCIPLHPHDTQCYPPGITLPKPLSVHLALFVYFVFLRARVIDPLSCFISLRDAAGREQRRKTRRAVPSRAALKLQKNGEPWVHRTKVLHLRPSTDDGVTSPRSPVCGAYRHLLGLRWCPEPSCSYFFDFFYARKSVRLCTWKDCLSFKHIVARTERCLYPSDFENYPQAMRHHHSPPPGNVKPNCFLFLSPRFDHVMPWFFGCGRALCGTTAVVPSLLLYANESFPQARF